MINKADVLIIGAGAAGLMAAYRLSQQGKTVTVLEARNRLGGRIHTINHESFFEHVELGAEFVHGDLPITLALLQEAGIAYSYAGGEMVRYKGGRFMDGEQFIENWDLLMNRLNALTEDKSINDFLLEEFAGERYKAMRDEVWRYVSGYDTADPVKASCFALRNEWQHEDDGAQHRVNGGYCVMIDFLADQCKSAGGQVYLNSVVKELHWAKGGVEAVTADGLRYTASRVIVALPLGVLQADTGALGAISFYPPVSEQSAALQSLGFGAIIKMLLEFDEVFWEDEASAALAGKRLTDMAFLLSDEVIPTWWTQHPQRSPLLTGWLGGPPAEKMRRCTPGELLELGLASLSHIFNVGVAELKRKLVAWNIVNWTNEPFTRGSYSYDTVGAPEARKALYAGVDDTLFFAGEYLYEGTAMGTVEAALMSGEEVVKRMAG